MINRSKSVKELKIIKPYILIVRVNLCISSKIVYCVSGISSEELFFAFKEQYNSLLTKVNWELGFNDNIKFESKKCING